MVETKPKPKLTDAERLKRFVETAREVDASERAEDFDKAFRKVTMNRTGIVGGSNS